MLPGTLFDATCVNDCQRLRQGINHLFILLQLGIWHPHVQQLFFQTRNFRHVDSSSSYDQNDEMLDGRFYEKKLQNLVLLEREERKLKDQALLFHQNQRN
ncbi:hypothetical protein DY000_02060284 [Brassica cretica]|uniref:Uncharacterized protein n=1 Tax=Brassica cretica TaxID=69181 RepID=A0ABQ7ARD2_BRACR|nr:hypothetical protein DY000_02060284 [Brassica cretica]